MEPIWLPGEDDPPVPTRTGRVDIYPVGLLAALVALRRVHTHPNLPPAARQRAWRNLRGLAARMWGYARAGRWRELKNILNGYLAEPTPFPEGVRRCGSGWTRRRALRSLHRHGYRP